MISICLGKSVTPCRYKKGDLWWFCRVGVRGCVDGAWLAWGNYAAVAAAVAVAVAIAHLGLMMIDT